MSLHEMFAEEIINNLPENPVESVKRLVDGYLDYINDNSFNPDTHFEQCLDGYALISSYNNRFELGLELLQVSTDNKHDSILALKNSVSDMRDKLNYLYPGISPGIYPDTRSSQHSTLK